MLDTILGFKQKMGAVYVKDRRFPVTWVKVDPCVVTQVKHMEKNGYMAVQLGLGIKKTKNLTKSLQNHLKKISKDNKSPRYLREVKVKEESELNVGDFVKLADVLKRGDVVTVTGTSKGKGFAGVVKRWGFAGGPKTHGQSDRERAPGSIGQRTTPGRVYKGKKMAGRMGSDRVSVKSLVVIDIDEKNNLVAIKGAVPGKTGGLVYIRKIGEGGVQVEKVEQVLQVEQVELEEKADEEKSASADTKAMSDEKALTGKQGSGETKEVSAETEEIKNPPSREATEGEAK